MRSLIITNHAVARWKERIEDLPEGEVMVAIITNLAGADPKHLQERKLKKRTFYIPTKEALLVGTRGKIVTVLKRRRALA